MVAKMRRTQPTLFDPLNSGEDHKTFNRGCEVEVKKFDLHGNGTHKGDMQAISNIINAGRR